MTVLGGLLLLEDIAEEIGVPASTVRGWCRRGEFPSIKYPGKRRVFVPREWADAYFAGNCDLETTRLADGGRVCKPKAASTRRRP